MEKIFHPPGTFTVSDLVFVEERNSQESVPEQCAAVGDGEPVNVQAELE